jgi:hypothetical protein
MKGMSVHTYTQFGEVLALIRDGIAAGIKDVAQAAATELVERTPVKTGRARNSWTGSPKTPVMLVLEGMNTPNRSANATAASKRAGDQITGIIKAWQPAKESLFITNGTPYIGGLDVGTSTQAPFGMTLFAENSALAAFLRIRF